MSRGFKIFITVTACLPLVAAIFTAINWWLIRHTLHLNTDSLHEVSAHLPPIKTPLVLTASRTDLLGGAMEFLEDHELNRATLEKLPSTHDWLIDISWITRANPYPPLLAEFNEGYEKQAAYFSFGYLGRDERYHQVTVYSGEADTIPSFLVRKVRGSDTHNGDYFVSYAFLLSRTVKVDPKWKAFPQIKWNRPQIDDVRWNSYIGGSSDQIEELLISPLMTIAELLLGVPVAWWLLRRRRLRSA